MKALALLLLFACTAHARWVPFDTFRFQLVDEAERRPGFSTFRTRFLRALETRDTRSLMSMISEDIALSLLDKSKAGKAAFLREWKLDGDKPQESSVWNDLRETLRLGGSFDDGEFRAPYVFSRWPERFPHMDYFAVTSRKCAVHKAPEENSPVLETLTQEIVGRFDALPNPKNWKAIRTASGVTGYISGADARSPLDYRAIFHRGEDGNWKLRLFAAGDWEAHERSE